MKRLSDFVPFLKEQVEYHDRQLIRLRSDPAKKKLHEGIAKTFRELTEAVEQTQSTTAPNVDSSLTALTPADLAGLPPELLAELNLSESDSQDLAILNMIGEAGGVMSLDKLIIALYRKTKEVHKRAKLTSRLYRMVQREVLFTVPKKKAVYTTKRPTEAQTDGGTT